MGATSLSLDARHGGSAEVDIRGDRLRWFDLILGLVHLLALLPSGLGSWTLVGGRLGVLGLDVSQI